MDKELLLNTWDKNDTSVIKGLNQLIYPELIQNDSPTLAEVNADEDSTDNKKKEIIDIEVVKKLIKEHRHDVLMEVLRPFEVGKKTIRSPYQKYLLLKDYVETSSDEKVKNRLSVSGRICDYHELDNDEMEFTFEIRNERMNKFDSICFNQFYEEGEIEEIDEKSNTISKVAVFKEKSQDNTADDNPERSRIIKELCYPYEYLFTVKVKKEEAVKNNWILFENKQKFIADKGKITIFLDKEEIPILIENFNSDIKMHTEERLQEYASIKEKKPTEDLENLNQLTVDKNDSNKNIDYAVKLKMYQQNIVERVKKHLPHLSNIEFKTIEELNNIKEQSVEENITVFESYFVSDALFDLKLRDIGPELKKDTATAEKNSESIDENHQKDSLELVDDAERVFYKAVDDLREGLKKNGEIFGSVFFIDDADKREIIYENSKLSNICHTPIILAKTNESKPQYWKALFEKYESSEIHLHNVGDGLCIDLDIHYSDPAKHNNTLVIDAGTQCRTYKNVAPKAKADLVNRCKNTWSNNGQVFFMVTHRHIDHRNLFEDVIEELKKAHPNEVKKTVFIFPYLTNSKDAFYSNMQGVEKHVIPQKPGKLVVKEGDIKVFQGSGEKYTWDRMHFENATSIIIQLKNTLLTGDSYFDCWPDEYGTDSNKNNISFKNIVFPHHGYKESRLITPKDKSTAKRVIDANDADTKIYVSRENYYPQKHFEDTLNGIGIDKNKCEITCEEPSNNYSKILTFYDPVVSQNSGAGVSGNGGQTP